MAKKKSEIVDVDAPISLTDAVLEAPNGLRAIGVNLAADKPRTLVVDSIKYEHTGEDEHGRWIYSDRGRA